LTDHDGRLERGRARRDLILDAAVDVIASGGVSNLTHRAVASAAGVSLASITYHFPGIADLRLAAFNHAGSRIGLAFRSLVEAQADDPGRIPEIAAEYSVALVGAGRQDTLAVYEMILAASRDSALQPVINELDGHLADLLVPFVGNRATALNAGSSIQGLILSHIARGDSVHSRDLYDAVADLIHRYAISPD
jgi:DNA-binding transcriptional regulator YbjK